MLRRRSCCPEELSISLSRHKQDGLVSGDNRIKKMKMVSDSFGCYSIKSFCDELSLPPFYWFFHLLQSPFPEVVGEDLTKINHQKTTRKRPLSPDTVPSEAIAVSEDNIESLLKPSQMLKIQKAMAVTNQSSIGINEGTL